LIIGDSQLSMDHGIWRTARCSMGQAGVTNRCARESS
jgi:hypothetical protein